MNHHQQPWIDMHAPLLRHKLIVTVSMEGYIPEFQEDAREANTKGGLGAYFGDKLEGLNAIGVRNAFGCMPMYHKRLVQQIHRGHQTITYQDVNYDRETPLRPLLDSEGHPVRLEVWGLDTDDPQQEVRYEAEVFCIYRGGTPLYLIYCPAVFDVLYPDHATHCCHGRRRRFLQETVFAQCVPRLFKQLEVVPDVMLINEGHVAVAAAITRGDPMFDRTAIIYTNHTVVPAGLEVFDAAELANDDIERARYLMRFPPHSWQWLWQKFIVECDGKVLIDFSKGALEICSAANAVSKEHARVTHSLFPGNQRHIIPILNGSGDTWVQQDLLTLEQEGLIPSGEKLLTISQAGKAEAFSEIQRRTQGLTNQEGHALYPSGIALDPNRPTVWLVRRLVDYKSQYPILKDIVDTLCADRDIEVDSQWGRQSGLGMQVVVGGIASQHSHEEEWIKTFLRWMQRPELRGRFVFVPGCDTALLRFQATGADICLNCPQPQKEACGTSDQRSARNGGINVAVHSGGPPEYLEDGKSGMLIGPYINSQDFFERAAKDILDKLRELADMYYTQPLDDSRWRDMKFQSYLASRKVTARAMEERYAEVYTQAIRAHQEKRHHEERESVRIMSLHSQEESQESVSKTG